MAQQQQFCNVDPRIWQECAGDSFTVPKLHSRVYYFPIGHLDHSPITPTTQTLSLIHPIILCTLSSVDFLADLETDQIFAKLLLTPVIDATVVPPVEASNQEDNGDRVVSYAKTLTTSDANNKGSFYVPRACADSIFLPLDLTTPSPSQELSVTYVCGVVWTICHVHRGNPERYLFTTGWNAFVKKKHLVVGDTLVFIKNSARKIFVGIRRHNMSAAASKITEKTVINAVELAKKNTPFEVMCYPTVDGFVLWWKMKL
ncbi:auxin response factor 17-like [Vicia villosa]|uniref:auxin response factor 17-like n=1 Tax=Vicia villosa TaxID=3911 RepID=UPI00273CB2A8|nr:auxin response factor 17-like [Vicia villosa]